MDFREIRQHQRIGSVAAQRALNAMSLDYEAPIDVFSAIEAERVWLMFQPLDHLYGAYRRHAFPGVVIHSGHPVRLQRFTAAHEFGHHILGHDISIDSREEVEATASLPPQEVQAQAFAATFLMPVQLVNRALSRIDLPRQPHIVSPDQAYRLSLELGSSYSATVTQLRALDRITAHNAQQLLRVRPLAIKTDLAQGNQPENSRADVWPLELRDNGRQFWVGPGDELHAMLPETPTTGYRWRPEPTDPAVTLAGEQPVQPDPGLQEQAYGSERRRHLWWRALEPASATVAAELRRSFGDEETLERFEVSLRVQAARTGDADHGLSRRQLAVN